MKGLGFLRKAAVSVACVGFVFPHMDVLAAGPKQADRPVRANQASVVHDVALNAGGTLVGRVVDANGQGLEGALVILRQGDREVARTVTDAEGRFVVKNLRGGLYAVTAGQSQSLYRVWTPEVAPPAAADQAVLVSAGAVVRGQFGGLDVITVGTLGASITAATLAIINNDDIDDLEDQLNDAIDAINALSP